MFQLEQFRNHNREHLSSYCALALSMHIAVVVGIPSYF